MSKDLGVVKGEQCNRDGCSGIIDEHLKEGGCSCHINPPCGYCTTDTAYCPVCDWKCTDELEEKTDPEALKRMQEYYQKQNEEWDKRRIDFYKKFNNELTADKLEMIAESHTHFSMIKRGVFPEGTETVESLLPKVRGTFGGRFTRLTKTTFEYIAYTD